MSRISPLVRGLLIIAAIALAIVILNQETALATAGTLLQVAFFLALALAAYMLWRDFGRREISIWPTRAQQIFYAAVGLGVADLAWYFLVKPNGRDALAFFVVLVACVYTGVRTWRDQRHYS